MIVRNEQRIIERCLASVAPYLSAWAICDTGSTDDTPAVIEAFFRARAIPGQLHRFDFVNFEQARNAALHFGRGLNAAFDYLLLVDADMEMEVIDPGFRDQLTAEAYDVAQRAGISYWNTRLVRRTAQASYRGVTHEYLEVKGSKTRLSAISFIDHAEGSSRVDKVQRDIALLQGDLAEHPDNVRSWFYLGQTLRDAGRWDEAVSAYQRRIALGGWAEESWYARLQIARCLLKQGDEGGFVHQALAAWSERPSRAEPLYDLARYHRDRSQHAPAALFAAAGLAIGWPKDDALFIEDWVYNWSLREEYSIVGYYLPQHRDRAAGICDQLALDRGIPDAPRAQARRNLPFYARPLKELLPSFAAQKMDFTPEPSWHAMNPSVFRWKDELWAVQRLVNYRMTEDGGYVTADAGPVKTRNFLLRLDGAFAATWVAEILPPENLAPPRFSKVQGFEDLRPFIWQGAVWATATVREMNAEGFCETVLCRIDQARTLTPRLADWQVLRPAGPRRHEKNWMFAPSGEDIRFIYSLDPTIVVDGQAQVLSRQPSPWAAEHVRGGSQAVRFGDGWLAICHEHVAKGQRRRYLHRFVLLDPAGAVLAISAPFVLLHRGVEFVAGLAWHPDGKRLVLSFGVKDAESWIATIHGSDVQAYLKSAASAVKATAGRLPEGQPCPAT